MILEHGVSLDTSLNENTFDLKKIYVTIMYGDKGNLFSVNIFTRKNKTMNYNEK